MALPARHTETHRADRIGWLRAAVLGANDGIVSTASLVIGIAASHAPPDQVLLAGVAGLVAGAMSMAAGEYVSVSSQADTERADLARGLDAELADRIAEQLMGHDALGAHARDELGITDMHSARPVQAAFASAATFAVGAAMPLLTILLAPAAHAGEVVAGMSLVFLAVLGGVAAQAGGAPVAAASLRVTFWGALAMALTAAAGAWFGAPA